MAEIFDDFRALVKKDPAAVKRWVDWTNATRRMNAAAPLASHPVAAGAAANLSDLFLSLQGTANKHIMDFQDRQNANRAQMMQQFAQQDAGIKSASTESDNYMQELAKRLGIQDALVGKQEVSARDDWNRLQQLNQLDKTNQVNSYDRLRQGYGEIMGHEAAGYDAQHAQALAALYASIPPEATGGGSGGSGGSGRSGSGRGGGSGGPSQSNLDKFYATVAANEANPGVWVMKQNDPDVQYAQHWNIQDPGRRDAIVAPPTAQAMAAQRRLRELQAQGNYAQGGRH